MILLRIHLTPSAMRKCSPLLSVFSMTKLRNALRFSGRVMSPSPSTPPSPETHRSNIHTIIYNLKYQLFPSERWEFHQHTVIGFKQLARRGVEVLQFEIAWPSQRHPKALCMPAFPPQNILWEATRPRTDVAEVQRLALTVLHQRFLYDKSIIFIEADDYMDLRSVIHQRCCIGANTLTPWESFGLVNM